MLSINNTNYSPNFGCTKQATEKVLEAGKGSIIATVNEQIQRSKHSLKLDQWGHVISTIEECEEFLRHADKEILAEAKIKLIEQIRFQEKLYLEYFANPSAFKKNHPMLSLSFGLKKMRYNAVELCRAYQSIVEKRARELRHKEQNPFENFTKIKTDYPKTSYGYKITKY